MGDSSSRSMASMDNSTKLWTTSTTSLSYFCQCSPSYLIFDNIFWNNIIKKSLKNNTQLETMMQGCFIPKRKNQEKEKDSKGKHPEASITDHSYIYSDTLASTWPNQSSQLFRETWLDSWLQMHLLHDSL